MRCFTYFFIRKLKENSYYIHCGVSEWFPALRKAVTARIQYYNNFNAFDIANLLCQVNKWMAKRCPFLIQGCLSRFFWIMAAKNTKKIVFLTDTVVRNFLEAKVKQNMKRKIESYALDPGKGTSSGRDRISTTVRFVIGRFWPCSWKHFFLR